MFVSIKNTRIEAIRTAVPSEAVSIDDELEYYGGSPKKAQRAKSMIGTAKRRLAWPGQTASDLCFAAATNLLSAYPGISEKLDALVFVSQSPDYDLPATACALHGRLGLPASCGAFDVNQGCAGYVYGLWLAASMINSGCENILLLAGDVPYRPRPRNNRVMAPIFGDGGSATLLCHDPAASPLDFMIGADGRGYRHIIVPAGRGRFPLSENFEENRPLFEDVRDAQGNPWRMIDTYMDGKEVFAFTLAVIPDLIRDFMQKTGAAPDAVDYFILHQANGQIVREVAEKAGLPLEKTPADSFSSFGNLSSASIPAAICHLFGNASITARLLLCGFGVGLAWGCCLWQADKCNIKNVISVPKPDNAENLFQAQVDYWRKKMSGEDK